MTIKYCSDSFENQVYSYRASKAASASYVGTTEQEHASPTTYRYKIEDSWLCDTSIARTRSTYVRVLNGLMQEIQSVYEKDKNLK